VSVDGGTDRREDSSDRVLVIRLRARSSSVALSDLLSPSNSLRYASRSGTEEGRSWLTDLEKQVIDRVTRDRIGFAVRTEVEVGTFGVSALVTIPSDRRLVATVADNVMMNGFGVSSVHPFEIARSVNRYEVVLRVNCRS